MRLPIALIGLAFATTCFSQNLAITSSSNAHQVALNRKIELMVRSQFDIPSNCDIKVEARTPSTMQGFDTLRLSIKNGNESADVDFLISSDDKTLGRLEKFNLDANPALLIDIQDRPIRGSHDAPVTVVSFDDLECPVCARMHQILFPGIFNRYGNQVRVIYKDNPLLEIHPWALHAAVNGHCLADQNADAYWSYVDYVHTHGQEVTGETREVDKSYSALDKIATEQGAKANVNPNQLQACLRKQDETPVRQSMKEASSLKLNFTPALFVNGEEIHGLTNENDVWTVIDRALREAGSSSPDRQISPQTK